MDLESFRQQFYKLKSIFSSEENFSQQLEMWLEVQRYELPLFPTQNLLKEDSLNGLYHFQGKRYHIESDNLCTCPEKLLVEPLCCIGRTWLYSNDRTESKPFPDRLAQCLVRPLETMPELYAEQLGEFYLCEEGNHRIYASYLLGRKVKIYVYGKCEECFDKI